MTCSFQSKLSVFSNPQSAFRVEANGIGLAGEIPVLQVASGAGISGLHPTGPEPCLLTWFCLAVAL